MANNKVFIGDSSYYQCECHNKNHTSISKELWGTLIKDKYLLEDTACMVVDVRDNEKTAYCQCAWCNYKETVDLTKTVLTLVQHGDVTILGQVK
jgi:hypothetical protein